MKFIAIASLVAAVLVIHAAPAAAECNCVAVAGYVDSSVQASVATADSLYAKGDYDAALELYAEAYGHSKDAALLYAQAWCQWQLGASVDAKALFRSFADAGGNLELQGKADAAVGAIESGVTSAVGWGKRGGGEVVGTVEGTVGGATRKPKKVAKGAAIVLGVVAVVAVGAVLVKGIRAGISDDISFSRFDKGFSIGAGVSGLVMGASAVYLWGLTATAGAAGSACGVGVAGNF